MEFYLTHSSVRFYYGGGAREHSEIDSKKIARFSNDYYGTMPTLRYVLIFWDFFLFFREKKIRIFSWPKQQGQYLAMKINTRSWALQLIISEIKSTKIIFKNSKLKISRVLKGQTAWDCSTLTFYREESVFLIGFIPKKTASNRRWHP